MKRNFATCALLFILCSTAQGASSQDVENTLLLPIEAERRVVVQIQFARDGTIESTSIFQSSGIKKLDDAALEAVARTGKLPPVLDTKEPAVNHFTVRLPVIFRMDP